MMMGIDVSALVHESGNEELMVLPWSRRLALLELIGVGREGAVVYRLMLCCS